MSLPQADVRPGRLTLVPIGGLCNRLRALYSAWHIAETVPGCRLTVAWPVNAECRAAFDELFRMPDGTPWTWRKYRPWDAAARKRNLYLSALVRRWMYDRRLWAYVAADAEPLRISLRRGERVWISTGSTLCDYPPAMARRLQPSEEVQVRLDAVKREFRGVMVGVHIRRTDNSAAVHAASVDDFRRRMHQAVADEPATHFYLATDDAEVKGALCREFADRIVCQRTDALRRDTLSGMREAMVDLYALAATGRILGSYWSSFTDMAAEMGDIPVEIVRSR